MTRETSGKIIKILLIIFSIFAIGFFVFQSYVVSDINKPNGDINNYLEENPDTVDYILQNGSTFISIIPLGAAIFLSILLILAIHNRDFYWKLFSKGEDIDHLSGTETEVKFKKANYYFNLIFYFVVLIVFYVGFFMMML